LLDFTKDITIISPKIDDRVKQMIDENSLVYLPRKYKKEKNNPQYLFYTKINTKLLQNLFFL